jgi:MYXO-CTERM domain-containing protein
MFEWQLLKADTATAFTDWLDANKFPHGAESQAAFDYYVAKGWYFVAFKVTASAEAPPPNYRICGDLGPIIVSFATPRAVIPSKIAVANGMSSATVSWRVFFVGQQPMTPADQPELGYPDAVSLVWFNGILRDSDFQTYPALASMAAAGDWLTWFDKRFTPAKLTEDLAIDQPIEQKEYRYTNVKTVAVDCSRSCSTRGVGGKPVAGFAFLSLIGLAGLAGWRKHRRLPMRW